MGALGVIGYVSAYSLLQIGVLKGDGWVFPFFNLVAALCILTSLMRNFNPFSAMVENAWATISIIGLIRLFIIEYRFRFTEGEAPVLAWLGQGLGKDRARKLLQVGQDGLSRAWNPSGPREGARDRPGAGAGRDCRVSKGGVALATLGQGALIGELTFMSGAAATADVQTDGPARLFLLPAAALRALVATDAGVASLSKRPTVCRAPLNRGTDVRGLCPREQTPAPDRITLTSMDRPQVGRDEQKDRGS